MIEQIFLQFIFVIFTIPLWVLILRRYWKRLTKTDKSKKIKKVTFHSIWMSIVTLILIILVFNSLVIPPPVCAVPSTVARLIPPKPVLVVLYKNGTYFENVTWSSIQWSQVDKVGILRTDLGKVGFESTYGNVLWYPLDFNDPIMFIAQRLWGLVGSTWYRFYIQTTQTKTPWISYQTNKTIIGWSGTITYTIGSRNYVFPVSQGVEMPYFENYMYYKTNVTTPINLNNVGLEYRLYANPSYKDTLEKYANYIRLYYLNGTTEDYKINGTNLDLSYKIPSLVSNIGILVSPPNTSRIEVNKFNFTDVFIRATGNKLLKIERVTLPNGRETYVIEIGCTFGSLAKGEKLIIDPSTVGTTTQWHATDSEPQRKTFRSQTTGNYYYAFFSDGTDMVYSTSSDSSLWSSKTSVRSCLTGYYFDIGYFPTYNTTYVYYVYFRHVTNNPLIFCRGSINVTGNGITWESEITVENAALFLHFAYPVVGCESDGTVFVGCCRGTSTNHRWVVYNNTNNDGSGSWTLKTDFSDNPVSIGDYHHHGVFSSCMGSNKVYCSWEHFTDALKGRMWDGVNWGNIETIVSGWQPGGSEYYSQTFNSTSVLVGWKDSGYYPNRLRSKFRLSNGTWLATDDIETDATGDYFSFSVNQTNNYWYCFYTQGEALTSAIYYRQYITNWGSKISFVDEEYIFLSSITSFFFAYSGTIGVMWVQGSSSPYSVRYAILSFIGHSWTVTYTTTSTNSTNTETWVVIVYGDPTTTTTAYTSTTTTDATSISTSWTTTILPTTSISTSWTTTTLPTTSISTSLTTTTTNITSTSVSTFETTTSTTTTSIITSITTTSTTTSSTYTSVISTSTTTSTTSIITSVTTTSTTTTSTSISSTSTTTSTTSIITSITTTSTTTTDTSIESTATTTSTTSTITSITTTSTTTSSTFTSVNSTSTTTSTTSIITNVTTTSTTTSSTSTSIETTSITTTSIFTSIISTSTTTSSTSIITDLTTTTLSSTSIFTDLTTTTLVTTSTFTNLTTTTISGTITETTGATSTVTSWITETITVTSSITSTVNETSLFTTFITTSTVTDTSVTTTGVGFNKPASWTLSSWALWALILIPVIALILWRTRK